MRTRRATFFDQRGLEAVEWIALGLVMLVLIAGVDAVLNQNGQLRNAIYTGTSLYASHFGRDITGRGPRVPPYPDTSVAIGAVESEGEIVAPDAPPARVSAPQIGDVQSRAGVVAPDEPPPAVGPATFDREITSPDLIAPNTPLAAVTDARMPVVVDPRTGVYTRLDPTAPNRISVSPAAGIRATVDPATGQIAYVAPSGQMIALLNPQNNTAVLINPVTNVRTEADLETLWRLGVVEIRRDTRAAPSAWIAQPTIGVPALFAAWR